MPQQNAYAFGDPALRVVSLAFRDLAVDLGLLPVGARPRPLDPFVDAAQSRPFPLGGRALAFVGELLAFVGQALALVGDLLALIGDPASSTRQPFTSSDVGLPPGQGLLALIERVGPTLGFLGRLGPVFCGHNSP